MSATPPTVVVMNPSSSGGATGRRRAEVEQALRDSLGTVSVRHTSAPGDATVIVREALREGTRTVIAVGGDGTIHEVVNGFFDTDGKPLCERPVLGIVPSGTGGDFRRTWGIERKPVASIAQLACAGRRKADLACCTWTDHAGREQRRYFANILSMGLGGAVSQSVNDHSKALGGRVSFFLGTMRVLVGFKRPRVEVRLDDGPWEPLDLTLLAVCTGRYFGGGMMVAPDADPSDGMFDVVRFNAITNLRMVTMTSVYSGRHLGAPGVSVTRAARVEVRGTDQRACAIEGDGEVFGRLPMRVQILPGAYEMMAE